MLSDATISADGAYRYDLTRTWADRSRPGAHSRLDRLALWVMLNPSTADAEADDPTIRRVVGFTRREGLDGFAVVNLFALRASDPRALLRHPDPHGPENDSTIDRWLADPRVTLVVFAWGSTGNGTHLAAAAGWYGHRTMCLGVTKDGRPRHPLYVRSDQPFVEWGAS